MVKKNYKHKLSSSEKNYTHKLSDWSQFVKKKKIDPKGLISSS